MCAKFGLTYLPLLDVSHVGFMLVTVYSVTIFKRTFHFFYLYFLHDFIINIQHHSAEVP